MKFLITFLTLMLSSSHLVIYGQNAKEIVQKADEYTRGKSRLSVISMELIRPDWERKIEIKSWEKGQDYALILIMSPAKDKGITFLKRKTEMWNWIPAIDRVIKMPPSMMMQSWMGSDFTNDDLIKESSIVHDYTHKIIGEVIIDSQDCHKIELLPNPDAPVVWGMVMMWITKSDFLVLHTEYYDEDIELVNILEMSDIMEMGGRVIPTVLRMKPVDKPDNQTVITYLSLEFDLPIDDKFFSEQKMKRVR